MQKYADISCLTWSPSAAQCATRRNCPTTKLVQLILHFMPKLTVFVPKRNRLGAKSTRGSKYGHLHEKSQRKKRGFSFAFIDASRNCPITKLLHRVLLCLGNDIHFFSRRTFLGAECTLGLKCDHFRRENIEWFSFAFIDASRSCPTTNFLHRVVQHLGNDIDLFSIINCLGAECTLGLKLCHFRRENIGVVRVVITVGCAPLTRGKLVGQSSWHGRQKMMIPERIHRGAALRTVISDQSQTGLGVLKRFQNHKRKT